MSFSRWFSRRIKIKTGDCNTENSTWNKLFAVKISKISYIIHPISKYQTSKVCKKNLFKKLYALTGVGAVNTKNASKRTIFMNAFFDLQCKYCPLQKVCHGRNNNSRINTFQNIYSRIINNDTVHHIWSCLKRSAPFLVRKKMCKYWLLICV